MQKRNIFKLAFSILLCQLAGLVGSIFVSPAIPEWYTNLIKPCFAPPNWIFGPVWTVLYTMMGVSLYLVWTSKAPRKKVRLGLWFFGIQLVLNSLWTVIFFGLAEPLYAFFEIIILWVFILLTTRQFIKIKEIAGWLLVPYISWVTFAAFLNFAIWHLNF